MNFIKQNGYNYWKQLIRLTVITGLAYFVFSYVLLPVRVSGKSMEPTITDGTFKLGFTLPFKFGKTVDYGDLVLAEFQGKNTLLLKRVVGLPGDLIEFRDGVLWRNKQPVDEPYVEPGCDWQLAPRVVKPGYIYIVGDNRVVPMKWHTFGQLPITNAQGVYLW